MMIACSKIMDLIIQREKERLETIIDSIKQIKDFKIDFKDAPLADIRHYIFGSSKKHIEKILSNIPKEGLIGVEKEPYADTMLCPNSKNAILRSCGAGIAAADDLMIQHERIFVPLRPRHHAESAKASDFVFLIM